MLSIAAGLKVFLAPGPTDMRKSFRGLALCVNQVLRKDPRCGQLFVFCNRRGNLLKILFWEGDGFWLFARKIDRSRFRWPAASPGRREIEIDAQALSWLLSGLDWQSLLARRPATIPASENLEPRLLPEPDFLDLL